MTEKINNTNSSSRGKSRVLEGKVISEAMQKTLVVQVDRTVLHPRYRKRYIRSKRYLAHDEKEQFHVGDNVRLRECRPLSKRKRWRVLYS